MKPYKRIRNVSMHDLALTVPGTKKKQTWVEVTEVLPDGRRIVTKEQGEEEVFTHAGEVKIPGTRQRTGAHFDFKYVDIDKSTYEALRTTSAFMKLIECGWIRAERVEE